MLINDAAKRAKDQVRRVIRNLPADTVKHIRLEWITFSDQKAVVTWVEVPDDRAAYTIFGTMNDRGLDLSMIDLTKNHLFYKAEDQQVRPGSGRQ